MMGPIARHLRPTGPGQAGWFDGNPTKLIALPEKERASRLVALIGGVDRLLERGQAALTAGDFTWAAELADYVLVNDTANQGAAADGAGRAPDQRHRQELRPDAGPRSPQGPSTAVTRCRRRPHHPAAP